MIKNLLHFRQQTFIFLFKDQFNCLLAYIHIFLIFYEKALVVKFKDLQNVPLFHQSAYYNQ